jgi:hypothetical protein
MLEDAHCVLRNAAARLLDVMAKGAVKGFHFDYVESRYSNTSPYDARIDSRRVRAAALRCRRARPIVAVRTTGLRRLHKAEAHQDGH